MLTENGYRIIATDSADDALQVLLDGAAVDLLVSDVVMPGLDGFALASEAKRLQPSLRVSPYQRPRRPRAVAGRAQAGSPVTQAVSNEGASRRGQRRAVRALPGKLTCY